MPAKRPRVLQTFNREPVEIVVQAHDAVAGLRGNDYFPGPRGSGLHHLGEDYVIQVRRYLCRACRRTVSLLPEFLLPYLRFAIEGIASFLKARLWSGQTLKAAAESAHQSTMPYRRAKMPCRRGQQWV